MNRPYLRLFFLRCWTSNTAFRLLPLVVAALLIVVLPTHSQEPPDPTAGYEKKQVMIPTRDGTRMNTVIYSPKAATGPLPMLLLRTPYGIGDKPLVNEWDYLKALADDGYIFVFQDIRGKFLSEGQFVMSRPPRNKADAKAIDEGTDAYDSIDWLVKNVPANNGRVGMLGGSYDGWLTVMAILEPHPALKAVSPQASPADMYMGDDFHHNGAFRLSYGYEYAVMVESAKDLTEVKFDNYDTYDWYLHLGPLSTVNEKYLHGKLPTWNDFVEHPNYDSFWQKAAVAPYLKSATVPALNVAGWWDQEDFYGPIRIFEELEKHDTNHTNYLVVGPWNHGGWAGGEGTKLGKVDFESATSRYYRERIQAPWFAYFLKDKGDRPRAKALTFQTGSNKWESYDEWPPRKNSAPRNLYMASGGRLDFSEPQSGGATQDTHDTYVSDPASPVPYRPRPIEPTYFRLGSGWYTWLLEDQRFADHRPDVLTWQTDPLKEDLVVAGDIVAHLFASTTGSDSDWIAKLIDVYPEEYPKDPKMGGYELMIANDVMRGRFRKSFEKPEPIQPGHVDEYVIDLHTNDHCFSKGHRIMVQVQSSWFPIIDRNPQRFIGNIFKATAGDFQTATQRIYRTKDYPSHVSLPILTNAAAGR
jgi:putative CocE/NonD family hydrolase